MTTATHPPRRIEDICPPWCAGHTGTYQGWENTTDGGQLRNHAEEGRNVNAASVIVLQVENEGHALEAPIVEVYAGSDVADLTPTEARELAAVLIAAADRAEAHR